jgi:uncharacterized protein YcaQ
MTVILDNRQARRIFLQHQGLTDPPGQRQDKDALLGLIRRLGFVQVDSINTLERAHHMILFSRNQTYRREHLRDLLERDRSLFENWTHDAAIIPSDFYGYWHARFERERTRLLQRWSRWRRPGFTQAIDAVRQHVSEHGELMSRHATTAPGDDAVKGSSGWWDWHPSKTALEFMWRTGELAVSRREGFQKVYDLSERVLPHVPAPAAAPTEPETVEWACASALDRLGFATPGELAAFWDAVSVQQVRDWARRELGHGVLEALVHGADDRPPRRVLLRPQLVEELTRLPDPPRRLRLLSPFDPVLRDRARCQRLFGFRYRIEVFVPAAKRRYGYYVFPMLEGDALVGRIDVKLARGRDALQVLGLWWEPGVGVGRGRGQRLQAELARIARFVGASSIEWQVPEPG